MCFKCKIHMESEDLVQKTKHVNYFIGNFHIDNILDTLLSLASSFSFCFYNMATGTFQITHVACITFLLDSAVHTWKFSVEHSIQCEY